MLLSLPHKHINHHHVNSNMSQAVRCPRLNLPQKMREYYTCRNSFYLFDACALLFVSIVGQLEVLCHIVIPGCLLDLNLLCQLEDFLLELGDGLFGALGVWSAIITPWEWTICPTGHCQGCLAQSTHLQTVDLKWRHRRRIKVCDEVRGCDDEFQKKIRRERGATGKKKCELHMIFS